MVKVYARAKVSMTLMFQIKRRSSSSVGFHSPLMVSNLVDGNWFSGYVSFPILNWNTGAWLVVKSVHVANHDLPISNISVTLLNDRPVAPGQVMHVNLKLLPGEPAVAKSTHCSKGRYLIALKVVTNFDSNGKVALDVHCRSSQESFLFTFVDYDGSIQSAAVIKPFEACSLNACPVLLTLHGTGKSS